MTGEVLTRTGENTVGWVAPTGGGLPNTGTPGTYGDATHVPQFTTDAEGRVTAVTEVAISGGSGSGAQTDLPSYAPSSPAHRWEPRLSAYNVEAASLHAVRSKLAAAAYNTGSVHIGVLSDSTMIGYNGSIYDRTQSVPMRLAQALARYTGNPYYTSGWTWAAAANGGLGDRWTLTGSWSEAGGCLVNTGAATATLANSEMCTDIYIAYSNLSPNFSYTVDGGSSVNVTTTGTSTTGILHITGLAYGYHTVVLTLASLSVIVAQRWDTPSLKQIHVHNLGFGGANANGGSVNGINWSSLASASPQGLGYIYQSLRTASSVAFDAVLLPIGSNDLYSGGGTAASVQTGVESMLGSSYIGTATPVLVHEIPINPGSGTGHTDATQANLNGTNFFSMADEHDCAMFDWNDFVSGWTAYQADAQAGADGIHPIYAAQNAVATALAHLLVGRDLVAGSRMFPNLVGVPGGRYKLIEASGSYPLRPPVPDGWCDYVGSDQPTYSRPGDTWQDLP